jgi:hypothetical protein
MQCPSCGIQVSETAATCAVCGEPLVERASVGGSGRLAVRSSERAVSGFSRVSEPAPNRCPACGSPLEREASFCSECGAATHTGEFASPALPEIDVPDVVVRPEEDASFEEEVVVPPVAASEPDIDQTPVAEDELNRTGPIPVVREPTPADPWSGWVPVVAAGFALFALLIAVLVHVFGPSSLPNYSPAEVNSKIQMRAVEWLLAGILAALVGILAKR